MDPQSIMAVFGVLGLVGLIVAIWRVSWSGVECVREVREMAKESAGSVHSLAADAFERAETSEIRLAGIVADANKIAKDAIDAAVTPEYRQIDRIRPEPFSQPMPIDMPNGRWSSPFSGDGVTIDFGGQTGSLE